jgi:TPR repeat protein
VLITLLGGAAVHFAGKPAASQLSGGKPARLSEPDQTVVSRALAGDPLAQLQLGRWRLEQAIHAEDYHQAAEWLRKAAESGNAEAQYRLGTLCQSGRLTSEEKTNALFWFQKAAAQQHVAALFNLGSMYGTGDGVKRDPEAAARFFRAAAQLGDAYAQFNLGRRCAEGQGIPTNLVEAWEWFELAEAGGIESAREPKHAVEERLTVAELGQARRAAAEVKKQLAARPK